MSTHTFYSTSNDHNVRQIRILSVGSLVSKPPTKEKRISVKVRMPLSGPSNMGAPEWLDNAYTFVAKSQDSVTPNIEFKGYSIDFSVENLFGESVSSPSCAMRGFEVYEAGDVENPDVVMDFSLRMGFSTALWNWFGQYVGDDVWVKFTPGTADDSSNGEDDGTLLDDGENDEEETAEESVAKSQEAADDFFGSNEEEEEPAPHGKSGPKELQAFHEEQVEAEQATGRKKKGKSA